MKPIDACRHLQNKAFFFAPLPEGSPEHALHEELSTPCWCLKTHEAIGPDEGDVWIESCKRGRKCYEAEVEL